MNHYRDQATNANSSRLELDYLKRLAWDKTIQLFFAYTIENINVRLGRWRTQLFDTPRQRSVKSELPAVALACRKGVFCPPSAGFYSVGMCGEVAALHH